jgi:hypothetical protein
MQSYMLPAWSHSLIVTGIDCRCYCRSGTADLGPKSSSRDAIIGMFTAFLSSVNIVTLWRHSPGRNGRPSMLTHQPVGTASRAQLALGPPSPCSRDAITCTQVSSPPTPFPPVLPTQAFSSHAVGGIPARSRFPRPHRYRPLRPVPTSPPTLLSFLSVEKRTKTPTTFFCQ